MALTDAFGNATAAVGTFSDSVERAGASAANYHARLLTLANLLTVPFRDAYAFGQSGPSGAPDVPYANAGGMPLYPQSALGSIIARILAYQLENDPVVIRKIARAIGEEYALDADPKWDLVEALTRAVRGGAAQQLVVELQRSLFTL